MKPLTFWDKTLMFFGDLFRYFTGWEQCEVKNNWGCWCQHRKDHKGPHVDWAGKDFI